MSRFVALRSLRRLAVADGPAQLLRRHQDLAQGGIHHCLARVQTRHPRDRLLVLEDEGEHRLEHLPALGERRARPWDLRLLCFGDGAVDALCGRGIDAPESLTGCGRVALDERRAGDFQCRVLECLSPPARLRLFGWRDIVRHGRLWVRSEQQVEEKEGRCTDCAEHKRAVLVEMLHGAQWQSRCE
jgi:hypothetical protein